MAVPLCMNYNKLLKIITGINKKQFIVHLK